MNTASSILNTVIPILSGLKEWYFDYRLQEIVEPSGASPEDLETTKIAWVKDFISFRIDGLNVADKQKANELLALEVFNWINQLDDICKKAPF